MMECGTEKAGKKQKVEAGDPVTPTLKSGS